MATTRRGAKINPTKNSQAHREWIEGKRLGRPKQKWVPEAKDSMAYVMGETTGQWVKV